MIKLALPIAAALALGGCGTPAGHFAETNKGAIIATTCVLIDGAHLYFQQHVAAGKIGPLTLARIRAAMSIKRALCARPPSDFASALLSLQRIYIAVQDSTRDMPRWLNLRPGHWR